jgi:hypothetical protein
LVWTPTDDSEYWNSCLEDEGKAKIRLATMTTTPPLPSSVPSGLTRSWSS